MLSYDTSVGRPIPVPYPHTLPAGHYLLLLDRPSVCPHTKCVGGGKGDGIIRHETDVTVLRFPFPGAS